MAVAAVMFRHSDVSAFLLRVGWIGVDLFFVLSGFLISGLLFSEYKKRHTISLKRFFIRRGLKIYPAFYVFLLLTGVMSYLVFHTHASLAHYLQDVFFIMNYTHGVWDHTWSLGVEEHFYIFLPILLLVLVRFSSDRRNPFAKIPWVAVAVRSLCIVFRAISVDFGTPNIKMAYVASHERMDALFFGVLLGYFYHFRPSVLEGLMCPRWNCAVIGAFFLFLLSFAYLFPLEEPSNMFATIGYTFIYLGFGGVLLLSLYVHGILPRGIGWVAEKIGSAFAFCGVYSYSIYLWHGPMGAWFPGLMRRAVHFPTSKFGNFAAYFMASFVIGITMSRLIEYPILHLRDRFFPQPQVVAVSPEVPEG